MSKTRIPMHCTAAARPSLPDCDFGPDRAIDWLDDLARAQGSLAASADIRSALGQGMWIWPSRELVFITDVHADADGLYRSLLRGGLLSLDARGRWQLTSRGRRCTCVIGGDCFDKGPSNLELLVALDHCRQLGLTLVLLAGNHDVRTDLGLRHATSSEVHASHWWVRMGLKSLPLLREVLERYGDEEVEVASSESEALSALMPDERWWEEFPRRVRGSISQAAITKELERIELKTRRVMQGAADMGMSAIDLQAATMLARRHLCEAGGEFTWFFDELDLLHRDHALLFVHAGICDGVTARLLGRGPHGHRGSDWRALNREFRRLRTDDPLELYFGDLGNVFRTKYRATDHHFSASSGDELVSGGIRAIVHGHVNHDRGQQLSVRHGVVHIECDTSIDRNTRVKEGISAPAQGFGVTSFKPRGQVWAASGDHEGVRCLDVGRHSRWMTIV